MSVADISPHRIVMASAGTGKTFRLTGRFIEHALRELEREAGDPGERPVADFAGILATTFTRKAAGEILDRVLERLSEAAADENKLQELCRHIGPNLTRDRCVELLTRLVRDLHRLNVLTIDALFLRIASAFALELGIPPGWRVAEEDEDERLRSEALDAVLDGMGDGEAMTLLEMLRGAGGSGSGGGEGGGGARRSVRGSILDAVSTIYTAFLQSGGRADVWRVFGPENDPLDDAALAGAVAGLRACPLAHTQSDEPVANWKNAHDAAIEAAAADDWSAFLKTGLAARVLVGSEEYSRKPIDDTVRAAYAPLIRHAGAILLARFADRNAAAHALAERFHRAYEALKLRRGLLRFDDVPRLLETAALRGRLDELYFRLDARLRHVLLDEFQDTSISQFRLLEPIFAEILAADDGRSVFCVGDIKQSLYMWRDAEPGLMPAMPERWGSLLPEHLEKSFRSSPVITGTVNLVFDHLRDNPVLGERSAAVEEWASRFRAHSAAKDLPGAARLWAAPKAPDKGAAAQSAVTMAFAASRVAAILEESPGASLGVLVRSNKHIPRLIYELRKLGVEASEEGGSPLLDDPAVAVAVSLLQLADFPGDSAAAYHVAASPLGPVLGLTAPVNPDRAAELAASARARLTADGYAGTLRWILRRCAAQMDLRGYARFNQLIDLAQGFDEHAGARPAEFVRLARDARVEDPARCTVRVMSIHKSKGLEFDAVVLPDLQAPWEVRVGGVLVDRPGPFEEVRAATNYPSAPLRALCPPLAQLHQRCTDRAAGEELCCLYVAMTRAVHALEMIVHPSDKLPAEITRPSAAAVLRAALAPDDAAEPGAELWRSDPFQPWAKHKNVQTPEPPPEPAPAPRPLRLAAGPRSFVPRRPRISPSSLEGAGGADRAEATVAVSDLFSLRGEDSRAEGTLLHAWFELIEWLDPSASPLGPPEADLLAAAAALGVPAPAAAPLIPAFRDALAGETGAALGRDRYAAWPRTLKLEARREHPFDTRITTPDGKTVELTGQIDRLVLARDDSGRVVRAEVLDFKTDRVSPADPAGFTPRVDHYRPQLHAYRRAVAAMYRLEDPAVTAALLFIRSNTLVPITPDTPTP